MSVQIAPLLNYDISMLLDILFMKVIDKTVEAALIPMKTLTFSCLHYHQHLLLSLLIHKALQSTVIKGYSITAYFSARMLRFMLGCYNLAPPLFLFFAVFLFLVEHVLFLFIDRKLCIDGASAKGGRLVELPNV